MSTPNRERPSRLPSRRQALRAGLLGGFGLSLSGLLRHEAFAAGGLPAKAKSVILLWVQGGVSHHETFDPKPDAPAEIRGEMKPIATKLPGVQFCEGIPRLAGIADQLAVLRSVTHPESAHERGSMYMVEGRRPPKASGTSASGNPEIGSLVAHQLGSRNGLPAFVSHPGNDFTTRFTGTGWLPHTTAPFRGFQAATLRPAQGSTPEAFRQRQSLRERLERGVGGSGPESWDRFQQEATDILASGKAAEAFDISREPDEVRKLYGVGVKRGDRMGELTLAARRLVEAGVRLVTVGRDSWDFHENIFPSLRGRLPALDDAFAGLVLDLKQRGLLDETLVVYLTEYGRTPKINAKAGRDHWPTAFSVAFAGAGIRAGQVIGASDRHGADVKDSPVTPEQIAATLFHLLGIPPKQEVMRLDGRPTTVAEEAEPLKALLA